MTDEDFEKLSLLNNSHITHSKHMMKTPINYLNQMLSITLRDCNNLSDQTIKIISQNCFDLESLHIHGSMNYSCNSIQLPILLQCCSKIQALSLTNQYKSMSIIIAISNYCKNLKYLNLSLSCSLRDDEVIKIIEQCTKLSSLNLYGCHNITNNSLMKISQYCTNLQSLDISYCCYIKEQHLLDFIHRSCITLKEFKFLGTANTVYASSRYCLTVSYDN